MTSNFIQNLKEAQITLVGLGLMAGSLAMRLKQDQICHSVVALVRRKEAAREAEQLGVVDWATTDPALALKEADIVIFVTPVRILIKQLQAYSNLFKPGAIITDMGSTKQDINNALAKLPATVYPLGSHPMCGKEVAGLSAAEATLYNGATWVITPLAQTPSGVVQIISQLASAVGSNPFILDPKQHDTLVAAISHLPYLLSSALVLTAQTVAEEDDTVWQVASTGFKDTSRLAASHVGMMMDILLTNQEAVTDMINRVEQQLTTFKDLVANGDEQALKTVLDKACKQRQTLYPPDE